MNNNLCLNSNLSVFFLSILLFISTIVYAGTENLIHVKLESPIKVYSYTSDSIYILGDSVLSCSYRVNGGVRHRALNFTSVKKGSQTFKSSILINHLPKSDKDTTTVLLYLTFPHGDTIMFQQMVFSEPRLQVLAIGVNSNSSSISNDSLHFASSDAIRIGREIDAVNTTGADVTYLLSENGRSFTKQDIIRVCDSIGKSPLHKASYKEPVILYFSGHGKFSREKFEFYIGDNCTINNDDILDVVKRFALSTRTVYLVIDACESQYAIKKTAYEIKFGGEDIPKTILFYAASYKQRTKEDKVDSIGVFTREFLNAIHNRNYTAFSISRYMKSHYENRSTTELFVNKENQSQENELKEHLLVKPHLRPFINLHYTWSPLLSHGIAASLIVNEKVPLIFGFTAAIGNKRGDGFVTESCFSPTIGTVASVKYYTLCSGGVEMGYRINDYISAFIGANYVPIKNVPYLDSNQNSVFVASITYPMWTIHPSVHLHLPTKSPYIKSFSFRFGYHFLISKYDGCSYAHNFADPQMFTNQLYKSLGFLEMGVGYTLNIRK